MEKAQVFTVVGFIILLLFIPLAFTLIKQRQDMGTKTNLAPSQVTSPPKEVPGTSPLQSLNKLLESTPTATPPINTDNLTVSFGPTLSLNVNFEGRASGKQKGKVFVGIAKGQPTTSPKYLISFNIDIPTTGNFSGLSLAGLDNNTAYTAYIKGQAQIDVASIFTVGAGNVNLNNGQPVLLPSGDLNEDNIVNSADYTIAKSLYGKKTGSPGWNEWADFNGDGMINNLDLGYIIKNFGKTGASGAWYSPIPLVPSPTITGQAGGPNPSGGYWLWMP